MIKKFTLAAALTVTTSIGTVATAGNYTQEEFLSWDGEDAYTEILAVLYGVKICEDLGGLPEGTTAETLEEFGDLTTFVWPEATTEVPLIS
jgi:hypothetical protein